MIHRFAVGLVLSFVPSLAVAGRDVQNVRYTCDRGVEIPVVYVNSGESSIAVLVVEGTQILLYAEEAASGARYGWPSDGSNYVWLTQGTGATLYWRDGATKTETALVENCTQT